MLDNSIQLQATIQPFQFFIADGVNPMIVEFYGEHSNTNFLSSQKSSSQSATKLTELSELQVAKNYSEIWAI